MITFQQALDAVMNCDEIQAELAKLRREVATLRTELTHETMRANEQQAKAEFYFDAYISQQKRKECK